tara:strand:- start:1395 stop:2123 length:729 start_codon:yes stop_codon:yes gene_type:complete
MFDMARFIPIICIPVIISLSACDVFKSIAEAASVEQTTLSQEEIRRGLREALHVSTDTSVYKASTINGFLGNAAIKIIVPSEAQRIIDKTRNIPVVNNAVAHAVENFEKSMNRAAEDAAGEAKVVFKEVIQNITFQDVVQILNGENNAATKFLENNARQSLYDRFYPIVDNSMSKKNVDQTWSQVTGLYNQHVGGEIETDLNSYITNKALDGLFYLIAEEETKIRKDPLHRVTEILQKVFGS